MQCQHEQSKVQSRRSGIVTLSYVGELCRSRKAMRIYFEHECVDFFLDTIERQLFFLHVDDQGIEKCHASSTSAVGKISDPIFDDLDETKRKHIDRRDERALIHLSSELMDDGQLLIMFSTDAGQSE